MSFHGGISDDICDDCGGSTRDDLGWSCCTCPYTVNEEVTNCGCKFHHPEGKKMIAIAGPNGLMTSDVQAPIDFKNLSYDQFVQWVKDHMPGRIITDRLGIAHRVNHVLDDGTIVVDGELPPPEVYLGLDKQ